MEKKSQDQEGLTRNDVIKKSRNDQQELDVLLAVITPGNIHKEVDYGPAVGKEAL